MLPRKKMIKIRIGCVNESDEVRLQGKAVLVGAIPFPFKESGIEDNLQWNLLQWKWNLLHGDGLPRIPTFRTFIVRLRARISVSLPIACRCGHEDDSGNLNDVSWENSPAMLLKRDFDAMLKKRCCSSFLRIR
jgi:hypothetical protein